jgi:hypothetical protein
MATGSGFETTQRRKAEGESGRSQSSGANSPADSSRQVKFSGIKHTVISFSCKYSIYLSLSLKQRTGHLICNGGLWNHNHFNDHMGLR